MNQPTDMMAIGKAIQLTDGADVTLIATGLMLVPHGAQKLFGWFGGRGMAANIALFDKLGWHPGWFWGNLVAGTEAVGGALIVLGLLGRVLGEDLAILVGPDQKWMSTTAFLDKIDANLKAAMA